LKKHKVSDKDSERILKFYLNAFKYATANFRWSSSVSEVFHYTSQAGLIGILRSVGIRATDIRFLNDSVEFEYGTKLFNEVVDEIITRREVPTFDEAGLYQTLKARPRYSVSFTSESDSLAQWGMYGDFAIGWKMESLTGLCMSTSTETLLFPCVYKESEQIEICNRFINYNLDALDRKDITEEVVKINLANFWGWTGSFFKHPSFELEKETRIVTFLPYEDFSGKKEQNGINVKWSVREGKSHPIPFVSIGIPSPSSIIIGPGQSKYSEEVIKEILLHTGLLKTEVRKSKLPFQK